MKAKHLARTLSGGDGGHSFTCCAGVRHHWIPVRVRGRTIGIACLRNTDAAQNASCARGTIAHPASGSGHPRDTTRFGDFKDAVELLRLIVRLIEALDTVELLQADLAVAVRSAESHEQEESRLRNALHDDFPCVGQNVARVGAGGHAEQTILRMLEPLCRNQGQRLPSLKEIAADLHMNTSYLSTMFSHQLGIPFSAYRTEIRLNAAKELLSDPCVHVSHVAKTLGYASGNTFLAAFKKCTGLSPSEWRDTFRVTLAEHM